MASLPFSAFELLFTANAPIAHHFQYLIAVQLAKDLRACARDLMTAAKGSEIAGIAGAHIRAIHATRLLSGIQTQGGEFMAPGTTGFQGRLSPAPDNNPTPPNGRIRY